MAGKKLLVADDSLTIQKVIRLALSNEGYEIQAVSDGNDAIQQVSLFRPDIVLIDVSLPGKSAFEVKRAINEHGDLDEVRFVLMSSAFEKVDEPQVDEVRFHGRLTKPFDPALLRQVLTDALAQVAAKRMEKTSILQRPAPDLAPPAPAPMDSSKRVIFAPHAENPGKSAPPPPPSADAESSHGISLAPPDDLDFPVMPQDEPAMAPPPGAPGMPGLDDWSAPVKPGEGPILSPPIQEAASDLWGQEAPPASDSIVSSVHSPPDLPEKTNPTFTNPTLSMGAPKFPGRPGAAPTAPAPPDDVGSGDDIRQLMESTIKMSGLDDFQWSVNEPSLKPTPNMADTGNSSFTMEPPSEFPEDIPQFHPERASTDFGSMPMPHQDSASSQPATQPREESASREDGPTMSRFFGKLGDNSQGSQNPSQRPTTPPPFSQQQAEASVLPLSGVEMEEMIRKQVQDTLEKMTQKLLPELAERLIKQEIHRMLSQQP